MSLKIALIISIVLQVITAIIAISLIKRTKTNIAWWLISLGFLLMAVRRVFEFFTIYYPENIVINEWINSWTGIIISLVMLASLSFIKRIFNVQERIQQLKKQNEARVFSSIIKTEENLKHHFSKELHDGLGPLLSAVKMALSAINNETISEKDKRILTNAEKLINESVHTVKEISNKLSPHVLNNFGLQKALKTFIGKLGIENSPKLIFKTNIEDLRFAYNLETTIYRIVCELITNSLKHAEAQNIYLDIFKHTSDLNISYIDDGKGFEYIENEENVQGLGILNIKSRLKSVNANFHLFSKLGEGFSANITIKID